MVEQGESRGRVGGEGMAWEGDGTDRGGLLRRGAGWRPEGRAG